MRKRRYATAGDSLGVVEVMALRGGQEGEVVATVVVGGG